MQPKSREVKYKDPNCYHEAVLFYRETFSLMPNRGFRSDIAVTVKTYEDLCIWQNLLAHWGYFKDGKWRKRSPMDIKGMLTVFEMKQRDEQRKRGQLDRANQDGKAAALSARDRTRIPERNSSGVSSMRSATERLYFGSD